MNFEGIMGGYENLLRFVAEITVCTLELVGILIIIGGSFKAIVQLFSGLNHKRKTNIIIDLGKTLALALEFKMGAEIVNTVIVRDLAELGTLAIVIALRAILSLLIHWEITNERKSEENEVFAKKKEEQKGDVKEEE